MKKALIVLLILALLILGGFLAFRHFVTDRIMDKGGMENPDYDPVTGQLAGQDDAPEAVTVLDGGQTYVDNDALLPVLTGTWESADGRYRMTLTEEYEIVLTLDGETVLEDEYTFTYLLPGPSPTTELLLRGADLTLPDRTVLSCDMVHEVMDGDENGRIILTLTSDGTDDEQIEFRKQ